MTRIRKYAAAIVLALGLVAFTSSAANATDNYANCTMDGKNVRVHAYTSSTHVVTRVTMNSTHEMNIRQDAYGSIWQSYRQTDGVKGIGGYFRAAPIDGDGLWNYEWNYNYSSLSNVGRIVFYPKGINPTANCNPYYFSVFT